MLQYLKIKHFAIIEHAEMHFKTGMTTITGETGAGKSILMQALSPQIINTLKTCLTQSLINYGLNFRCKTNPTKKGK